MDQTESRRTYTIAKVLDQILHLQSPAVNVGVEPFGEGLLLDGDPALLLSKRHLDEELLMRRFGGGEGSLGRARADCAGSAEA